MIIRYDGADYAFDMDDVTVKQAMTIERFMGCSFADWGRKLQEGQDLRARQALGWLILHADGGVAVEDTDFKMVKLGNALDAAFAAEAAAVTAKEEAAGPVPTGAASTGRTPAAAASSPAS